MIILINFIQIYYCSVYISLYVPIFRNRISHIFFNAMLVRHIHKYMFYKYVLELCFLYFAIFTEYFNKIVSHLMIFFNLNTNAFCLLLREKLANKFTYISMHSIIIFRMHYRQSNSMIRNMADMRGFSSRLTIYFIVAFLRVM